MQFNRRLNSVMSNWLWILLVFIVFNLLISGVGAFAVVNGEPSAPVWATATHPMMIAKAATVVEENWFTNLFINNWYRWDTGWYLKIASSGYDIDDHSTGFQPLYPAMIRLLNFWGVDFILSALILSRISCLVALFLLFKISIDLFRSEVVARRTIIFLLTFPSAFFLFVGYTESLALVFSLACFYLLMKEKWLFAGIAGGLAALTRIQGVVVMVPMLWIAFSGGFVNSLPGKCFRPNLVKDRLLWLKEHIFSREFFIPLFASFIPGISIGVYNAYLTFAGFDSITGAYSNWGTRVVFPWVGLWELIQRVFSKNLFITDYIDCLLFIVFTLMLLFGIKELPIAYSLYNLSMIALILMRGYDDNFLPGFMRYMLFIFPIFIVLGKSTKKIWLFYSLICAFLSVNLFLAWAFVNWFWIA